MATKYDAPPAYPQNTYTQQHQDAGPFPGQPQSYPYANQYPAQQQQQQQQPASADYYGQQAGPPPTNYPKPQQTYYGAPQGYYGQPPGQGMSYQNPPMGGPSHGYGPAAKGAAVGTGLCAAITGALACCCCLDLIF